MKARKMFRKLGVSMLSAVCAFGMLPCVGSYAYMDGENVYEWRDGENNKRYWYENGVRQGTVDDAKGVFGDGTNRGREIYDRESDGWYWLDSVYNGAKAVNKEVWIPYIYQNEDTLSEEDIRNISNEADAGLADCVYNAIVSKTGKWVRYDNNGCMIKGWYVMTEEKAAANEKYTEQIGNVYYYDNKTGLMAKGTVTLSDGVTYTFNEISGALIGEAPEVIKKELENSKSDFANTDNGGSNTDNGNNGNNGNNTDNGNSGNNEDNTDNGGNTDNGNSGNNGNNTDSADNKDTGDNSGDAADNGGSTVTKKYGWIPETITFYDPDGKVTDRSVYEYDENGRTRRLTSYADNSGNLYRNYETVYTYDSNGVIAKEVYTSYDTEGSILTVDTSVYDSGKPVKRTYEDSEDPDQSYVEESTYVTINGKRLCKSSKTTYPNGDGSGDYISEYIYDEKGNLTEEDYCPISLNVVQWKDIYTYNAEGLLAKDEYIDQEGNIHSSIEYSYDENKNLVTETYYDSNHVKWKETKSSYGYIDGKYVLVSENNYISETDESDNYTGVMVYDSGMKYSYSNGDYREIDYYYGNGEILESTTYFYKYDENGNNAKVGDKKTLYPRSRVLDTNGNELYHSGAELVWMPIPD